MIFHSDALIQKKPKHFNLIFEYSGMFGGASVVVEKINNDSSLSIKYKCYAENLMELIKIDTTFLSMHSLYNIIDT